MRVQRFLDFGATDVLAAANNDFLDPVHDVDEPFFVRVTDVACAEPAILERCFGRCRLIEIFADNRR